MPRDDGTTALPDYACDQFLREARGFLRECQDYREKEQTLRLKLMLLLVETHSRPMLWAHRYPSWDHLIRAERFCSLSTYRFFALGTRLLGSHLVQRLGVAGTIALAKVPASNRLAAIREVRQWAANNPQATSDEAVYQIRRIACQGRLTRNQLLAYISRLKRVLQMNGIPIPDPPGES